MRLLRWLSLKRRACLCNPSLLWLRLFLIIRNEWASVSVAPAHLVYRPHVDKESPPPQSPGEIGRYLSQTTWPAVCPQAERLPAATPKENKQGNPPQNQTV